MLFKQSNKVNKSSATTYKSIEASYQTLT